MPQDKEQSLISHLEELRKTLISCLICIAIILPFTFYFSPKILNFLIKIIISDNNITLNFFSPMDIFMLQLKLAILVDAIISIPYIFKKIWDFILPALYDNEKTFIKNAVIISSALFFAGVAFCIFIILPLIINFGLSFATSDIKALFSVNSIINLALNLSIVFGIMFQMPILVKFLIKSGVVSYEALSSLRPYVIVAILITAALLTPPDIISQILLFIPTYLLFEAGLLLSKGKK